MIRNVECRDEQPEAALDVGLEAVGVDGFGRFGSGNAGQNGVAEPAPEAFQPMVIGASKTMKERVGF